MKLRIKQIGELSDEVMENLFFSKPYRTEIVNDQNKIIGELSGCYIDTFCVFMDVHIYDGVNFKDQAKELIHLDLLPQEYLKCVSYVMNDVIKATPKLHNIIYLNKLDLAEEYASKECEAAVFDMMFEHAEMLIYDLDRTSTMNQCWLSRDGYWKKITITMLRGERIYGISPILKKERGFPGIQ